MNDIAVKRKQIKQQRQRKLWLEVGIISAIAIILILIFPQFLSGFRQNLLGRFLSLAILALGIDLIWGYTGLLSLGHGVFFALGGYALAMHLTLAPLEPGTLPGFMSLYGVETLPWFWQPFTSFPFTLLMVFAIPSLLAGIFGYLVFRNRIRGVYFSILTQATVIVFFNFFNGQQELFNGSNGLTSYRTLLGLTINEPRSQYIFYVATILVLIAIYALCRWLTSGRFGKLLIAIRDDEPRLRFTGYNPTTYKVFIFAVSAAIAGIAGALFTVQTGIISPGAMDIVFSIEIVIWVAVGGRATLIGAIFGAVAVNIAKRAFSENFPDMWLFFQGALFLIVVLALPNGVVGWIRDEAVNKIRFLLGKSPEIATYPQIETDPDIQQERDEFTSSEL